MDRLDPQTPYQPPDPAILGGQPARSFNAWAYREDVSVNGADLVGYKVEATDGGIGKADRCSYEINSSYLVVDTGPWIFGKKVMLPAGVVNHVDHDDRKVYVDRSKHEIKSAPEFDEHTYTDTVYRDKLSSYYGGTH